MAMPDVAIADIDRLHAGAAIALHRPARHAVAAAEPERRDPPGVDLVGDRAGAAEDHLVERVRREGLAHQQRPPGPDGEVDRRERPGLIAHLDERGAGAVYDINPTASVSPCLVLDRPSSCRVAPG